MTNENSIDYITLTSAISELKKVGDKKLVDKLQYILTNNELQKPDKHNKKSNKTTSYYKVDLNTDQLETIVELFQALEVKYLGKDFETTGAASSFASMADSWTNIKPTG